MINEVDIYMNKLRAINKLKTVNCSESTVDYETIINRAEMLFERIIYSAKSVFGNIEYSILMNNDNSWTPTIPRIMFYPTDEYEIVVWMWNSVENDGNCFDNITPDISIWNINPNRNTVGDGYNAGYIRVTENDYMIENGHLSIKDINKNDVSIKNDRIRIKKFLDLINTWCYDRALVNVRLNIHSMFEIPQEYVEYRKDLENNVAHLFTTLDNCLHITLGRDLEKVINNIDEETDLIQYYFNDKNGCKHCVSIGTDARSQSQDIGDPEPVVQVNLCISEYRYDRYWDMYEFHPMISTCFSIDNMKIISDCWYNISDSRSDNLSDEDVRNRYCTLIDAINALNISEVISDE